jgi:hypothetical protein
MIRRYILNNLIALDQWGNVLLGGHDMTRGIFYALAPSLMLWALIIAVVAA